MMMSRMSTHEAEAMKVKRMIKCQVKILDPQKIHDPLDDSSEGSCERNYARP